MRRFASVFVKRTDKSNTPSSEYGVSTNTDEQKANLHAANATNRPPSPSLTALPTLQLMPNDYASSSSGSASLRTPDDDATFSLASSRKKYWTSWFARTRSVAARPPLHAEWDKQGRAWNSPDIPILKPPPSGSPSSSLDTEEDETSSESEDDESEPYSHSAPSSDAHNRRNPVTLARARENAKIVTSNKIAPSVSAPPLLHLPGRPVFPRSSNLSRFLSMQETLASTIHRKRLLTQLQRTLPMAQEDSLLPFASRPTRPSPDTPCQLDNIVAPDPKRISTSSQGLKRWASRKPFEERMRSWIPDDKTAEPKATYIKGTEFGIPEVQFSESLEAMAGFFADLDPPQEECEFLEPIPSSSASSGSHLTVPADTRKTSYKAIPSNLQRLHGPSSPQISPSPSLDVGSDTSTIVPTPQPSASDTSPPDTPSAAPVKRGVRFAEDDKDDQIPLGHVLRMKQRREDKARFLQEEKERRAFEAEKLRMDADRMRREQERANWEKERKSWEREKKAMEEEKKQRLYAEEVAAARARRETQRAGYGPRSTSELNMERPRDSRQHHQPTSISSRKQAFEPAFGSSVSPYTGSSAESSRPPSFVGVSPSGNGRNSRPPSVYSALSSVEDLRPRDGDRSRRNSVASATSHRSHLVSYPAWTGPNIPPMPPLPVMPMIMVDMPLLPPVPPFMVQQHRSRQSASLGPSSSKRRSDLPSDRSSESISELERRQKQSLRAPSSYHGHMYASHRTRPASSSYTPQHSRNNSTSEDREKQLPSTNARLPRSASQPSTPTSTSFASSSPSTAYMPPPPNSWTPSRTSSAPNVVRVPTMSHRQTVIS